MQLPTAERNFAAYGWQGFTTALRPRWYHSSDTADQSSWMEVDPNIGRAIYMFDTCKGCGEDPDPNSLRGSPTQRAARLLADAKGVPVFNEKPTSVKFELLDGTEVKDVKDVKTFTKTKTAFQKEVFQTNPTSKYVLCPGMNSSSKLKEMRFWKPTSGAMKSYVNVTDQDGLVAQRWVDLAVVWKVWDKTQYGQHSSPTWQWPGFTIYPIGLKLQRNMTGVLMESPGTVHGGLGETPEICPTFDKATCGQRPQCFPSCKGRKIPSDKDRLRKLSQLVNTRRYVFFLNLGIEASLEDVDFEVAVLTTDGADILFVKEGQEASICDALGALPERPVASND